MDSLEKININKKVWRNYFFFRLRILNNSSYFEGNEKLFLTYFQFLNSLLQDVRSIVDMDLPKSHGENKSGPLIQKVFSLFECSVEKNHVNQIKPII